MLIIFIIHIIFIFQPSIWSLWLNVKSVLIHMTKPRTISIPAKKVDEEARDRKQTRRKRWRSAKLKRRARKKDSRQLQLVVFELDNRASVPRRAFGRSVFCPVARTSKWNPVRGTKPRILVDKLSLEERNIYIYAFARTYITHLPPSECFYRAIRITVSSLPPIESCSSEIGSRYLFLFSVK